MTNFKLRGVLAAVAGTLVLGMATSAMADATFDLVDALVKKGVLTEEEALPLLQGRENDIKTADKKVKKAARVSVSDAIDNATIYGDIRVRYEDRSGTGNGVAVSSTVPQTEQARQRARYKITLGVKTESGKWYSDIALAMGTGGRSDNATFGKSAIAGSIDDKEALFVKRAMVGYKATDWLTLEAGRMNNPLYTTPMVWDADLNFEGLVEKVNYKYNDADFFFTAAQVQYQGDRRDFTVQATGQADTITTELFAYQGGLKYAFNDHTNAKAGLTYSTYSHNTSTTKFSPKLATDSNSTLTGTGAGVNDLDTIEIPAEINFYMNSSSIGVRLFGDYVYNTSGDDRYKAAYTSATATTAPVATALANQNAIKNAGNDDTAWLLGVAVGSAADFKSFDGNKMVKGDWSARIWYQDVGAYSVDPNAVDSDFMDSRVNTKGTVLKTQYNLEDNVFLNFAYGHAERKNKALGTAGAGQDLALNWKDYDLFQLDLTYKF